MKRNVTMKDIASFLNIDRTTVSKALTGAPGVSPKTIEKVRQAAEQLGYRKDSFASSLQTGKNAVLGLILADFRRGIYAPLVEAFQQTAMEHQYGTILFYINRSQRDLEHAVALLKQQRVSGATFISAAASAGLYEYLSNFQESGIAVNTLEKNFVDSGIDRVCFDHHQAGYAITEHMIALGHRNIVFITYSEVRGTPEGRLQGYLQAMKQAGLPPVVIAEDKPDSSAPGDEMLLAYERLRKVWGRLARPTAIIGANDNFALGILHAIKEKGIAVPEEMSIGGFDDLTAAFGIPQLTTMRIPMKESGVKLAELLIRRIQRHELLAETYKLDYDLIARGSTTRAPIA